jgi:hypothetical protein
MDHSHTHFDFLIWGEMASGDYRTWVVLQNLGGVVLNRFHIPHSIILYLNKPQRITKHIVLDIMLCAEFEFEM